MSLKVRFAIFSIFNRLRICNRKKYMSNFYWSLLKTYMTTRNRDVFKKNDYSN